MNFILGQCGRAEIQAWLLCGWHLVNTDWTDYKVTSVLIQYYLVFPIILGFQKIKRTA